MVKVLHSYRSHNFHETVTFVSTGVYYTVLCLFYYRMFIKLFIVKFNVQFPAKDIKKIITSIYNLIKVIRFI